MTVQEQRALIEELKLFFERQWGFKPRSDKMKVLIKIVRGESFADHESKLSYDGIKMLTPDQAEIIRKHGNRRKKR